MTQIKFSFIIPVKEINNYIRESIPKILDMKREDFEIIIYPDKINSESWPKTMQITTGHIGPAEKRNNAIKDARGEILIFIDDDAYPNPDYLDKLEQDFQDNNIIAVGGPAITPPDDNFWQKVSGAVFLSPYSGGFPSRYQPIGSKRFIDDWPSVNLAIRTKTFREVSGFDCSYWPGEDTKLCLDLIKKNNGKILYDPNLIVWHHRRQGLIKHLIQVSNYGLHRGFFAKKFPETSLRFKYFLPSLFLLFMIGGAISSFFFPLILKLYILGWLVYSLALIKSFIDIRKWEKKSLIALNALYYIFLTHIIYGLKFIQGLVFIKQLKSKLR
ncbi:MAG: glycosyltransferase [Candidatus Parcubacteria bacterium]|nr:glycosyltransferase [Candidatus Parcubacteria bacterium]